MLPCSAVHVSVCYNTSAIRMYIFVSYSTKETL